MPRSRSLRDYRYVTPGLSLCITMFKFIGAEWHATERCGPVEARGTRKRAVESVRVSCTAAAAT